MVSVIAASETVSTSYTPLELATVYDFPDDDGTGQTIAIIELGGGFDQPELDAYFAGLGISGPTAISISWGLSEDGWTGQARVPRSTRRWPMRCPSA